MDGIGVLRQGEGGVDEQLLEGVEVVVGEVQRRQHAQQLGVHDEEVVFEFVFGDFRDVFGR